MRNDECRRRPIESAAGSALSMGVSYFLKIAPFIIGVATPRAQSRRRHSVAEFSN
jgi:hypothetical protein